VEFNEFDFDAVLASKSFRQKVELAFDVASKSNLTTGPVRQKIKLDFIQLRWRQCERDFNVSSETGHTMNQWNKWQCQNSVTETSSVLLA